VMGVMPYFGRLLKYRYWALGYLFASDGLAHQVRHWVPGKSTHGIQRV
jgi:hypothetical protein